MRSDSHSRQPTTYFPWKDRETDAEGWVVFDRVINDIAGGGIFMHPKASLQEVADVARNMSRKFTVTDPQIGGAKAGIRFDHKDPRSNEVLRRFLLDHEELLRHTWVTAGDLNTSDAYIESVIRDPKGTLALPTSQWALAARLARQEGGKNRADQLAHLMEIRATPYFLLVEAAVGYGLAEAVGFATRDLPKPPRVIIQGAGTVGSSLAYYLNQRSLGRVVAIADSAGWLASPEGLPIEELLELRRRNVAASQGDPKLLTTHLSEADVERLGLERTLRPMREESDLLSFLAATEGEVFSPCAGRYQVTGGVVDGLLAGPWGPSAARVLAAGANNPYGRMEAGVLVEDRSGEVVNKLQRAGVEIVPDWVANSGTAQFFHLALSRDFGGGEPDKVVVDMLEQVGRQIHGFLDEASLRAADQPGAKLLWGCEELAKERLEKPRLLR